MNTTDKFHDFYFYYYYCVYRHGICEASGRLFWRLNSSLCMVSAFTHPSPNLQPGKSWSLASTAYSCCTQVQMAPPPEYVSPVLIMTASLSWRLWKCFLLPYLHNCSWCFVLLREGSPCLLWQASPVETTGKGGKSCAMGREILNCMNERQSQALGKYWWREREVWIPTRLDLFFKCLHRGFMQRPRQGMSGVEMLTFPWLWQIP